MKRNRIALLLALLLALTLPLTALAEGEEPTYIKVDEIDSPDIITRLVCQIGDVTAPEEYVEEMTTDDGILCLGWVQVEGGDATLYVSAEVPFNPFGANRAELGMPGVREVIFGGAVDASEITIMSGMFKDCSKLERIDFTGFEPDAPEDMDEMFSGCASLTSLDLRTFHILPTTSVTGIFAGCTSLAEVLVSADTDPAVIAMLEAEMGDCAVHTVTVQ